MSALLIIAPLLFPPQLHGLSIPYSLLPIPCLHHFQNVYPTCIWMLALTPGLRSPREAEEM